MKPREVLLLTDPVDACVTSLNTYMNRTVVGRLLEDTRSDLVTSLLGYMNRTFLTESVSAP